MTFEESLALHEASLCLQILNLIEAHRGESLQTYEQSQLDIIPALVEEIKGLQKARNLWDEEKSL